MGINKIKSENIKNIYLEDKYSYLNKIFITLDLDWAPDLVIEYALNMIEKFNLRVTIFVTHNTKMLDLMRKNDNIEIGIHPNFNPLLNGNFMYGNNYEEVIDYYLRIVPDAKSARSHTITENTPIINKFSKKGILYDLNSFIPFTSGIELKPWLYLDEKLIKVPYFWEDDVNICNGYGWDLKLLLDLKGIKVFNFHPIHIFLNTEDMKRYEKSKKFFNQPERLFDLQNKEKYGTRNFFEEIFHLNI